MGLVNHRTFDGKEYTFSKSHFTKIEAKKTANQHRSHGQKARIVKRTWGSKRTGGKVTDYVVYYRR